MLTKESILENLDQPVWDATAMNAVIASKAEKRAQKGQALHMYTLDLYPGDGVSEKSPAYIAYLEDIAAQIYEIAQNSDQPTRIQLAVKTSSRHWTALDIKVSRDIAEFLLMDAAGDDTGLITYHLFEAIKSKYPSKNQFQSRFYFLKHAVFESGLGDDVPQGIQFSPEGCKYFALDNLFHTSNLDPFPALRANENQFINDSPGCYGFNAANMPSELGFMYKNTQSKRSFGSLPDDLKAQVINKKGQTLQQSEEKHSRKVRVKGVSKIRNYSIENKKTGFLNDTKAFIAHAEDGKISDIVNQRNLLTALENNKLLSSTNHSAQKIAENLVQEAKALDKHHRPYSSYIIPNEAISRAKNKLDAGQYIEAIKALEGNTKTTQEYRTRLGKVREKLSNANAADREEEASFKSSKH